MILSRLSGLDAAQSVEGLTAAFNSFKSSGITTAEILNKVVAVSQKFAVSERDIIEGLGRSASVADLAGVSFDELAALITAIQQKTSRGGAVIGNSLKTIFARIQDKTVLSDLQKMGIGVTDLANGKVLPALKILENLAAEMEGFDQIEQADISKKLGGIFQLDKLLAALKDLSSEASVTGGALKAAAEAGNSAYEKNIIYNTTLKDILNKVSVSAEQLGSTLGKIGLTDNLNFYRAVPLHEIV
jgi:TP901 family phage tail tape measure protein